MEAIGESDTHWSSKVEDLLDRGDVEGAISLLESLITNLETLNPTSLSDDLRLSCALSDLSNLYSSRGFSIKADELRSRGLRVKLRSQQHQQQIPPLGDKKIDEVENGVSDAPKKIDKVENPVPSTEASPSSDDDDWEAIADHASSELLSPSDEAAVSSNVSLEYTKIQTPKRRGRGAFLYKQTGLYSDQLTSVTATGDSDDEFAHQNLKEVIETSTSRYGTSHVLVLSDFPPSTRTTDLEKVFENFRDRGIVIRWVNDTVALAVFRSPSIAKEAQDSIEWPFAVRALDETDSILSTLSSKDLEPPIPRPKTSTRTAQRLIAQGIGRKVSTTFGSNELKKQEEARRNRILTRQIMRDEAWGPDDPL